MTFHDSSFWCLFALVLVCGFIVELNWRWFPKQRRANLFWTFFWGALALFLVFSVWWVGVMQARCGLHHVTRSINGHVFADYWTTNRFEVEHEARARLSTNGTEIYQVLVTNKLW